MEWTHKFTHLGLTFGIIWNYIKGGKSTPSRLVSIVLWSALMLAMLYVLSSWLSVPTYNHYIYLDRLFSERPPMTYQMENRKSDYYVTADYKLSLSSGVSAFKNSETTRFRENVLFTHEKRSSAHEQMFEKRKSWASIELNNYNPQKFNDILSNELSQTAQEECDKNKVSFNDFKYGYFFLHRYQEDIARYGITKEEIKVTNSEIDTLHKYMTESKGIEINHRTNGCLVNNFVQDKDMPKMPKVKFDGEVQHVDLSNIGYGNYSAYLYTSNQHVLTNLWYSLFKMYDLTKARYVLYLNSNAVDSVVYTIEFEEGVSFSDINVSPAYKDMNTLKFIGSDFKSQRELANGIKFYIEYLESSNIQTIRESILLGMLTIPLTIIIKNIWMLITNRMNNTPISSETEQVVSSTTNNVSRRKRKPKNKK